MFKQLQDMAFFALVAEMGSFTAAARALSGVPKRLPTAGRRSSTASRTANILFRLVANLVHHLSE